MEGRREGEVMSVHLTKAVDPVCIWQRTLISSSLKVPS